MSSLVLFWFRWSLSLLHKLLLYKKEPQFLINLKPSFLPSPHPCTETLPICLDQDLTSRTFLKKKKKNVGITEMVWSVFPTLQPDTLLSQPSFAATLGLPEWRWNYYTMSLVSSNYLCSSISCSSSTTLVCKDCICSKG